MSFVPLQGDSGGPLLCNNKLRGLTAYTYKDQCSNTKYPHVFMKVFSFVPWIQSVMQKFERTTKSCRKRLASEV